MNLSDIIALAKEGYKPSDIKELMSLVPSNEEKPSHEEKDDQDKKTEQHDAGKERPEEAPQKSTGDSSEASAIDEYKRKVEELEAKLQKIQSENVHKDNQDRKPQKSDDELLNDITRSFM